MMATITSVIAVTAAYLIGSLSFAIIVSRVMGIDDPRTFGSGNPGATNVLRTGSKKAAILTLLLDALKGYIPVAIAIWLTPKLGWSAYTITAVAVAAFAGHLYPLYFQFKGGKGVATSAGVLFAFSCWLGLAVIGVWLAVAVITRYSSLAALISAAVSPILYVIIFRSHASMPILIAIVILAIMLIYKHKQNIKNLIGKTESKIGQKKKE